ncbi:hypothetical protein HXX76_003976 [Chlamydomonas incerta]|uniref:BTB domain-containing protein n=1 Tax=Chlamydomonas incerta TaxID=51695 RepID=A0A835TIP5_CHLIN|nr:hypothetical protein HXX76_003976 [Chlamydomonas incerta]|eukprot:KAG2441124.1 hypothetical protein HXX76_003976 [Chlamydomonas incerta]
MSLKRKRSEASLLQDKPADLLISTADEQPIEAHIAVLTLISRVVDLPRAASGSQTTWDLCKLVLEGQSSPVPSAVVRQWLDLVYSRVDVRRRPPKLTSLSEAARSLLLFADAVGTCSPVINAIADGLLAQPGLTLPVPVNSGGAGGAAPGGGGGNAAPPQPLQLELALRGKLYYSHADGILAVAFDVPISDPVRTVVAAADLAPHRAAFPSAVAAALEGWLYLAGRLELVALVRVLLEFYKAQMIPANLSLLHGAAAKVLSRRVLECMPRELLVEGFASSCVNDPYKGQAEVNTSSKLSVVLTAPEASAWYGLKPNTQVEGQPGTASNVLRVGAIAAPVRLSVGGLLVAQQRQVLQEVLQQLEEEEEAA